MNYWLLHHARDIAIEKALERVIEGLFNRVREWAYERLQRIIVRSMAEMMKPLLGALVVSLAVAAFLSVLFVGIHVTRRAA
jgi:hypothetical protein